MKKILLPILILITFILPTACGNPFYTVSQEGVKFDIPKGWRNSETDNPVKIYSSSDEDGGEGYLEVNVLNKKEINSKNLQQEKSDYINEIKKRKDIISKVEVEDILVDGAKGKKISYEVDTALATGKVSIIEEHTEILLIKKDKLYIFSLTIVKEKKNLLDANKFIESIKFE